MSSALNDIDISDLQALLGTSYTIKVNNNSNLDNHNAVVFQDAPQLPSDVSKLAWLSKTCHSHTRVSFNWTLSYNFVWGQNGNLRPGASYDAGQEIPADINSNNLVNLSYIGGGFAFDTPTDGTRGSLVIKEDGTVPGSGNPNQGCVGIGMSGAGTFVLPTEPGYSAQFDPHPQYWLAFGRYAAGVVVDESGMTNPVNIEFRSGNTVADCVFDGKNWNITYS
ncbi:hypothetical protein [Actinokineospora sp. NBRC 105648]|uniref:hypothetical protein n=1 Tax=Actinokineospora sp. NBRC 105648 TaxID=3032206 RepID=UPI0024A44E15|nr:hypothetical protein [Actinokineospora sp. NBRC 105648]GLZ42473.1 hypothetical protein Acsp05_60970 [Actinokineospora sp. NBRC 105648]